MNSIMESFIQVGFIEHKNQFQIKRPDFFPCSKCKRKFTQRALEIHRRSCTENDDCECTVCVKSKQYDPTLQPYERIRKRETITSKLKKILKHSLHYNHYSTSSSNVKPTIAIKEEYIDPDSNFVKQQEYINTDSMVMKREYIEPDSNITVKKESVDPDTSFAVEQECIDPESIKDENSQSDDSAIENKPFPFLSHDSSDSFNFNAENLVDDIKPTLEQLAMPDHTEEPCSRRLFCCICKKHMFWETFGGHVIGHCSRSPEYYLQCPLCLKSFSRATLFLLHFYIHVSLHPLDCDKCRCSYARCVDSTSRAVMEHYYTQNEPFRCYICLKYFSHCQSLVSHISHHASETNYNCKKCFRSFRQLGNLKRHVGSLCDGNSYKCTKCERMFNDAATLKNHYRIHTGETPYICSKCNRGFTQVGNLKRHMALHIEKESPSTVEIMCKKRPVVSDNTVDSDLVDKEDKHSNDVINEVSSISANLPLNNVEIASGRKSNNVFKFHNRQRRRDGKYHVLKCPKCQKVFAWKHDLAIHFRTHTGEKPYRCELCDKRFAQSGAVRIHKIRHHFAHNNRKTYKLLK